ncbi:MAG TPA: hypothetical protein VHB53_13975 [Solirubrobacterales bacterium]|nr:hypothetical protein [Solirubrobacterales bacterium]
MPGLPDIPGKGLVAATTRRTWAVVAAAGGGALAVGGFVAKRVLDRGATEADGAGADPIAEPPTAPSGAAKSPVGKAPPKPEAEPGDVTGGKDPHHALNNPVVDDPDMTEYPDPYETREDPRDPVDPDDAPFGAEPHPQTGAESTSEPPLEQDPEVESGGRPPRRENLDD